MVCAEPGHDGQGEGAERRKLPRHDPRQCLPGTKKRLVEKNNFGESASSVYASHVLKKQN